MGESVQSKIGGTVLRPMTKDDCESIACIHADLDASPWNTNQWLDAYEHYQDAWVITRENQIVGYAIYRSISEQAELLNFGVRREAQGAGLGQELLESTLSLLPEGTVEVLLEVRRSNVPAINLYDKLGFNEVTVRRDYYPVAGGGREDALVLIKSSADVSFAG